MFKTLSISLGLVGMTAFGGMALSMAHDLSFAGAERVAPEHLQQIALAQPAPSASVGSEVATGPTTLRATPGDAQVINAIVESSGPHNRAYGKSIATASLQAPAASIAPRSRESFDGQFPRSGSGGDVIVVSAPVFERSPSLTYTRSTPRVAAPSAPAPIAVSAPAPAVPEPGYLIGVFR